MQEIFDKNNFVHVYFHGNQDGLDKANARKQLWEMFADGVINEEEREQAFKQIDRGEKNIVLRILEGGRRVILHLFQK